MKQAGENSLLVVRSTFVGNNSLLGLKNSGIIYCLVSRYSSVPRDLPHTKMSATKQIELNAVFTLCLLFPSIHQPLHTIHEANLKNRRRRLCHTYTLRDYLPLSPSSPLPLRWCHPHVHPSTSCTPAPPFHEQRVDGWERRSIL